MLAAAGVSSAPDAVRLKAVQKEAQPREKLAAYLSVARLEYFRAHPPVAPAPPVKTSLEKYPCMPRGEGMVAVTDHPLISLVAAGFPREKRVFFSSATPAPMEDVAQTDPQAGLYDDFMELG